jgi:hypothetical protein
MTAEVFGEGPKPSESVSELRPLESSEMSAKVTKEKKTRTKVPGKGTPQIDEVSWTGPRGHGPSG